MVGRGGFEFSGVAVATQSGGGSALFVLVVRGRRKEGASGENGGVGALWCWPAAELWLAQPAVVACGEAGAWEEGGGRRRLEERDRREERERMEEREGKDRGGLTGGPTAT